MECNYQMVKNDGSVVAMKEVTSLRKLCEHLFFRGSDGGFYVKESHSDDVVLCDTKEVVGQLLPLNA